MLQSLRSRLKQERLFILPVKVRSSAQTSACTEILADGTYKISIAAPAQDGKANAELIRFLAKELGLPKENIRIISGHTTTRKGVKIER